MANAEDRLLKIAKAAAKRPTANAEVAPIGVAAIELNNSIWPERIVAAMQVIKAARGVQSALVDESFDASEALGEALDEWDGLEKEEFGD